MPRPVLVATCLFLALHLYVLLRGALPWLHLPGVSGVGPLTLLLFSLSHAGGTLGWRRALGFFALCAGISWGFEQAGVATGWVYGRYHYSDQLGPRLGHVPLLIPVAWFGMLYASRVVADLVAEGSSPAPHAGLGRTLFRATLTAAVMTAWDLPMDPMMSGEGAWVWEDGGAWFGVPLHNFLGWLATVFTVDLAERTLARRAPSPRAAAPAVAALPVVAYAGFGLAYAACADPPALRLAAAFAMGLPVLAALGRLR